MLSLQHAPSRSHFLYGVLVKVLSIQLLTRGKQIADSLSRVLRLCLLFFLWAYTITRVSP